MHQLLDRHNEASREALHLADLVHQVDIGPRRRSQGRFRQAVDGSDIHPILADAVSTREPDLGDDRPPAPEDHCLETAAPPSAVAQLRREEAGDLAALEQLRSPPQDGGLADAGPSG